MAASSGDKRTVVRDRESNVDMNQLRDHLRDFVARRGWEPHHSPKNLAAALSVEAAELLEHFQWLTEEQSRKLNDAKLAEVSQEIGDVLIYLVRLSDELGIDPLVAAFEKSALNEIRYPADEARGKIRKRHHP